mmetsp:Transcript_57392/g.157607  ORF Transcript_57392/g.157607 Transcript_57392/m.157607 type:complete len:249 (+) Transcript_57392:40-786(+)
MCNTRPPPQLTCAARRQDVPRRPSTRRQHRTRASQHSDLGRPPFRPCSVNQRSVPIIVPSAPVCPPGSVLRPRIGSPNVGHDRQSPLVHVAVPLLSKRHTRCSWVYSCCGAVERHARAAPHPVPPPRRFTTRPSPPPPAWCPPSFGRDAPTPRHRAGPPPSHPCRCAASACGCPCATACRRDRGAAPWTWLRRPPPARPSPCRRWPPSPRPSRSRPPALCPPPRPSPSSRCGRGACASRRTARAPPAA